MKHDRIEPRFMESILHTQNPGRGNPKHGDPNQGLAGLFSISLSLHHSGDRKSSVLEDHSREAIERRQLASQSGPNGHGAGGRSRPADEEFLARLERARRASESVA